MAHYTCMAGCGEACAHIAAVLFVACHTKSGPPYLVPLGPNISEYLDPI